ncbi:MAG: AraC family transcriptional regulator, partial [bacterium]
YLWNNERRGEESFVIFQYTRQGLGCLDFGGRTYSVPAGHAFIAITPEASRYYYPPEGKDEWVFSWINFYGNLAQRIWGELRECVGPVVKLTPATAHFLETMIEKTTTNGWRDPYEASAEAYRFHLEVIRHLRPSEKETGGPLTQSLAYLRRHYQTPLRVKEVAAIAKMSREHFTRLFSQQVGATPAAYLRQIRVDAAVRLLRMTELSISEIAFRSGFSSVTQMGIFFKRKHNLTPLQFRESYLKNGRKLRGEFET